MNARPSSFMLTAPGPLRLYSTSELLVLPPPEWLIRDIMPAGGLVGLYGQPGTGKSFIAIDMAMAVGTGTPWHGYLTKHGYVIYVSAEGGSGIGKRVLAWLLEHQLTPSQARVAWLTESIPVHNGSEDMDVLMGRITDEIDEQPALVIIDTLARCFDGDENQQEDMGRFIGGVDRLRREFDATVIVVHHTRLDGDRERGNTAFRGAADTMISLDRKESGSILLTNNKQKDSEEFAAIRLRLKAIPEADSCVIQAVGQECQQAVLQILAKNGDGIAFTRLIKQIQKEAHVSAATAKRALVSLLETSEITKENGVYRGQRAHIENPVSQD